MDQTGALFIVGLPPIVLQGARDSGQRRDIPAKFLNLHGGKILDGVGGGRGSERREDSCLY